MASAPVDLAIRPKRDRQRHLEAFTGWLVSDAERPAAILGRTVLAVAMLPAVLLMPRDGGRVQTPAHEPTEVAAG
jgi:hypothetical protein